MRTEKPRLAHSPHDGMSAAPGCKPPAAAEPPGGRLEGGLYLVSVPIGNAADITLRAIQILSRADIIACEDTRSFRRLAAIHGISLKGRRPVAYHDWSRPAARARIRAWLREGKSVAYAPEAGTALVSDPGYRLVKVALELNAPVIPVPGASALLAALSVAGLPTDRFLFVGYPPPRNAARRRFLKELVGIQATLVFYEAPHRIAACLADMVLVFGDRPAAVAREMTKAFEEVNRGKLGDLAAVAARVPVRGEHVIVVGGTDREDRPQDVDKLIAQSLEQHSPRDAARRVAEEAGISRGEAYRRILEAGRKTREPESR